MTGTRHTKLAPERKAARKNGIFRLVAVLIAIIFEIALITNLFTRLNDHAEWINVTTRVVAVLLVLLIYNENKNAAFKTPWIILIMAVPIFGITMYLLVGLNAHTFQMKRRYAEIDEKLFSMTESDETLVQDIKDRDAGAGAIASYLQNQAHFTPYVNSGVTYFGDTMEALEAMLDALKSAEHFIFMEYFAIDDKEAWHRIEEILVEKVKAGKYEKVVLEPLMVVAGDHANNDMAGDDEDSWKTAFLNEGYDVECLIRGLGENEEIRKLYVEHAQKAIDSVK